MNKKGDFSNEDQVHEIAIKVALWASALPTRIEFKAGVHMTSPSDKNILLYHALLILIGNDDVMETALKQTTGRPQVKSRLVRYLVQYTEALSQTTVGNEDDVQAVWARVQAAPAPPEAETARPPAKPRVHRAHFGGASMARGFEASVGGSRDRDAFMMDRGAEIAIRSAAETTRAIAAGLGRQMLPTRYQQQLAIEAAAVIELDSEGRETPAKRSRTSAAEGGGGAGAASSTQKYKKETPSEESD